MVIGGAVAVAQRSGDTQTYADNVEHVDAVSYAVRKRDCTLETLLQVAEEEHACRSLTRSNRELGWWSNPAVYVGILVVLVLQAAFILLPFMHEVFGAAPLDARSAGSAAAAALLVLPVTTLEERWRRSRPEARRA
jgi:hypothetical protein